MNIIFYCVCVLFCFSCSVTDETHYKVARDPSWYPLNLMGKGASVLGFTDDVVREIAEEKDLPISLYLSSWASLEEGLKQKRFDAIISPIPPILGFEKAYSFSDPILLLGPVLLVHVHTIVNSLDDMKGKEIAIQTGSSEVFVLEKLPDINIRNYDSLPKALEDLAAEKIDGVLMPILPATSYVHDLYLGQLKIVTPPLTQEALRLITLKDEYPRLLSAFNKGLQELQSTNQYKDLLKKWYLN